MLRQLNLQQLCQARKALFAIGVAVCGSRGRFVIKAKRRGSWPRHKQLNTTMNKLDEIREQFPITRECFINAQGVRHAITYLDHGASTHPSSVVLDTYREFLERYYANIHRGNHFLSQKAS